MTAMKSPLLSGLRHAIAIFARWSAVSPRLSALNRVRLMQEMPAATMKGKRGVP